ncbi:MAG TPA: hypothetical protein VES64_01455 [Allosphingosinicella sp.]|nr:hypothetical protein [Allosphingosinicella sp.]
MRTPRLLYWLTAYYLGMSALLFAAGWLYPEVRAFLPIGGVEALLSAPPQGPLATVQIGASQVGNFGESLMWLIIAIAGALLAALPVSWTYMEIRARSDYDQSLVETIVVLPMIVTGIIIIVHNSLALAFAIAGIAAGVRFRNSLKSTGDALFILLAIGIGLSSGIGAVELAIVMSIAFNYVFLMLWITDYGARKGTQRFLRKHEPEPGASENALAEPEPGPQE